MYTYCKTSSLLEHWLRALAFVIVICFEFMLILLFLLILNVYVLG